MARLGAIALTLPGVEEEARKELERALVRFADVVNVNANSADVVSTLLTAAEALYGRMAVSIGSGGSGEDELYVCMKNAAGAYAWVKAA